MKMEKIVIFGTNEFSEYVYLTIKKEHAAEVVGFSSLKDFISQTDFCNLPVYPLEDLSELLDMNEIKVLITVGYTKLNERRENTYNVCKKLNYNLFTYISNRSICDSDEIGEGSIVMPTAYIPPKTKIGVCNVVNCASVLGHTSTIGDFNWFSGNVIMGGNVTIGNNCFIGMNCLIKNGVKVASRTMLGAYSYLNKDSKENKFYSGNPAINVKKLNADVVCDFI